MLHNVSQVYISDKQGKAKDDLTRKVFRLIKDEDLRREKITDDKFKVTCCAHRRVM